MLKKLLSLVVALTMLTCVFACAEENPGYSVVYSSENPIPEIAENVRPAVVGIEGSVETWDAVTRQASVDKVSAGSGCYILNVENGEGGYILTNNHIVQDCDVFSIRWLSGETMDADLVGYDDGTDIAVLRFNEAAPEGVKPIPMGDSDSLRIGELAICIGNPGSYDEILYGTVTAGIISGLEREDINAENFSHSVNTIQIDAAINTGNSGGALLNAKGELVGIPTLKLMFTTSVVFEGLGFCIPINTVRNFIDQIIDTGSVTRPRLGISVQDFDGPDEAMRKYPPIGVQVYTVEENGPSAKAGLMEKDIITEINGIRIKSYTELIREIDKCSAGDTVTLKVYRYTFDDEGAVTGSYNEFEASVTLELLP